MHPYRLPLKFILFWVINLAILITISLLTGFHETLLHFIRIRNLTCLYLVTGAILAGLEQALWDKLRGN